MFPFILGGKKSTSSDEQSNFARDLKDLERHSWRNWLLLGAGLLLSAIALGAACIPLLSQRSLTPWPWVNTNLGLLAAYVISICVFVAYLTYTQFKLTILKKNFHSLLVDNAYRNEHHTQRLYALFAVSRKMGTESNPQKIFDYITEACKDTFNCHQASLMLFDRERQMLVVQSASGHLDKSKVIGKEQKIGHGVAGWAAKHRQPLLLNRDCNISQYDGLNLNSKSLTAAMVVPIILRDELVGVVNVSSRSSLVKYNQEDMRALRVYAENAGTCIRHAEHVEWMRQTIQNLQAKLAAAGKSQELKGQPSPQ